MKICPRCLKQYDETVRFCPDDATELRAFKDATARVTGQVLDGRWYVEHKIAEGGMGEVYLGQQVSMNRKVAIKILRPAMAASPEYVQRFFREANIASTIQHPNFVHIYDFGQEPTLGVLYLAMEYLEGIDLAERIVQGRMALDHVLEVGVQVCSALAAAHQANIVHRDLKPENIFLVHTPGGGISAKVLDFGIAKELGATTSVTRTGQIFGTPEYMSPEQCQNFSAIDGRSDLYSLGCVLYELLTGRSPFHRDTVIATLLAQVQEQAHNLQDLDLCIPTSTCEIVHRLLHKDASRRYKNAVQARDALEAELYRVRSNPDEIEQFRHARRPTDEVDRQVHTGATVNNTWRRTSQFINLETFEHLEIVEESPIEAPAKPRRVAAGLSAGAAVVVVAGGALAYHLFATPVPPHIDPLPALSLSGETLGRAVERAETESVDAAVGAEGERAARQVAILATSLAMTTPEDEEPEPPPVATSVKRRKPPKDPLLDVRTPSSINKRAARQSKKLGECFALRSDVNEGGEFRFRFRILPDGEVDSVEVKSATPDTPDIRACIVRVVDGWSFAPSAIGAGIDYHERSVKFALGTR